MHGTSMAGRDGSQEIHDCDFFILLKTDIINASNNVGSVKTSIIDLGFGKSILMIILFTSGIIDIGLKFVKSVL